MPVSVCVAILGTSVVMAGIAHALRAQNELAVHIIECAGDLPVFLEQAQPGILIFDLTAMAVDDVRPFMRGHDGLRLIGIDITSRQALTFSTHSHFLHTLSDLQRLIAQTVSLDVNVPANAGNAYLLQRNWVTGGKK